MTVERIPKPEYPNKIDYLILGGAKDGERGQIEKDVEVIQGDGTYLKKQLTALGFTATFFVTDTLHDPSPSEILALLCQGYRRQP